MFNQNPLEKLVNSLESLTFGDRILEGIKLGKKEPNEPEIANLINDLQQGNYYHRLLALYSCYGSYNGERVLTAIKDNSRSIRRKAIDLITIVGSDRQILTALETFNYKQLRVLFKYLRKRNRLAIIDTCLIKLIERDEQKVAQLLVYGTAEIINRYQDRILECIGVDEWSNLARLHPEIALNTLQEYATKSTGKDWRFLAYFHSCISRLAKLYPDRSLALIQNLVSHPSFNDLRWQNLVYYRPVESAQLVLQSQNKVQINLNVIAHKLPQDLLINLIQNQEHTVNNYALWLPKLKPAKRTAIYEQCHLGWRDDHGCLSRDLIKLFPQAIREKEARYHLDLPLLKTRPTQRLPYVAFLPWDETKGTIQPYLQNPDADSRILALKTIIDATQYNRTHLPELLKIICDRHNEQDPVRNAMLYGLASLPPSIWQQEHLANLDTILTDTLKAADLSAATANHAQYIIIKILPFYPQWSAEWLSKLVQARGRINFYHLESRLNNTQVQQLAPILLPVFKSWETREREWNIIEAGRSFGRRLKVFDGLVDILERVLNSTIYPYHANWILNILSEHRRDRLAFLIPQLLNQDKSWFTQSAVNLYLHNFRQDLLTPFLGQTAYKGKFSTGKTRFVPFFYGGYSRWTDKQQTIFAQSLESLTRDDKRDTPAVWSAIEQLALLPAVKQTRLMQLASLKNPQEAIRDRALRALSKLDGGQGVPELLSALDDARARIAIYALRKCLLEMPVDNAVSILQNASWEKITVAKEIIRLLGDLASATAYQELLAWNDRDLHRDVRIALLRSLWEHLEKEETWVILEQAATDPDEAVATMVGRTPGDRLSNVAEIKLVSLLVTLLNRPEPTLRLTILQRCYQLPVRDTQQILLSQLLKSLNSNYLDEVKAAANAIFVTYRDAETIAESIKQIIPNRRSLNLVISSLQSQLSNYGQDILLIVRAIIPLLAIDPITVSLQIKLAVASLPWNELGEFLLDLNKRGELHSDALTTAESAILHAHYRPDIDRLHHLEITLAASEDEKIRRLALSALVAQTTSRLGWNKERVQRLFAYRQDSSVLVAAAAQFTFPPDKIIVDN
ncbi:MAG: hypothetical protein KME09_23220 [Pleurocapsa minor HA4230-MV1]|jgi:hypothetical protein|nr:hypothetical protein [Pleurocapsa minor HA4230-MV1]